jgi:hypothetical protein
MKYMIANAAALALLLVMVGCDKTTVEGPGGKKLTVVQPSNQTLKRGEINEIAIKVARTNTGAPLKVEFEGLPKGVTVIEDSKKISSDQNVVNYTLHAAPDADLVQNSQAKVTVSTPDGMKATETFTITVKDRA